MSKQYRNDVKKRHRNDVEKMMLKLCQENDVELMSNDISTYYRLILDIETISCARWALIKLKFESQNSSIAISLRNNYLKWGINRMLS